MARLLITDGQRVNEISELRARTKRAHADLLELSNAIASLDNMLRSKAKGFSMQSLYKEVPPALQGYVELVYDLNNNPSFRLLESLLYTSRYYKPSAQELMLSVINGDDRPFVLSTPRLSNPNSIRLAIPFADERVDWLFRLKRCPSQWREICERLQVPENEHTLLRSFFTSQSPAPYKPYDASGARWRYFGHACILVETSDVSILFDPVLSYTYESDISRYTYDDLPEKIDFVVITHNHQDHILFETLLQIRHKVKIFIVPRSGSGMLQDPSLRLLLEAAGCRNVTEIGPMESVSFRDGSIMGLPFLGEHSDLDIPSKLAYLVRLGGRHLLCMADSCNIEPRLYEHIYREIGE